MLFLIAVYLKEMASWQFLLAIKKMCTLKLNKTLKIVSFMCVLSMINNRLVLGGKKKRLNLSCVESLRHFS